MSFLRLCLQRLLATLFCCVVKFIKAFVLVPLAKFAKENFCFLMVFLVGFRCFLVRLAKNCYSFYLAEQTLGMVS